MQVRNREERKQRDMVVLPGALLFYHQGELHRNQQPPWLKTIIDFLQDNWQLHPRLDELARLAYVNPITVSKHFSRYMGCTLGEYMRKLKIQHALHLVHTSTMSLTEIAYHCGFADQSHFTRNFRALTHFLPKAYQKL